MNWKTPEVIKLSNFIFYRKRWLLRRISWILFFGLFMLRTTQEQLIFDSTIKINERWDGSISSHSLKLNQQVHVKDLFPSQNMDIEGQNWYCSFLVWYNLSFSLVPSKSSRKDGKRNKQWFWCDGGSMYTVSTLIRLRSWAAVS